VTDTGDSAPWLKEDYPKMPYSPGFTAALRAKANNPKWQPSDPELRKSLARIGSAKARSMLAEAGEGEKQQTNAQREALKKRIRARG
jgi:hypothetical protein